MYEVEIFASCAKPVCDHDGGMKEVWKKIEMLDLQEGAGSEASLRHHNPAERIGIQAAAYVSPLANHRELQGPKRKLRGKTRKAADVKL